MVSTHVAHMGPQLLSSLAPSIPSCIMCMLSRYQNSSAAERQAGRRFTLSNQSLQFSRFFPGPLECLVFNREAKMSRIRETSCYTTCGTSLAWLQYHDNHAIHSVRTHKRCRHNIPMHSVIRHVLARVGCARACCAHPAHIASDSLPRGKNSS